MCLEAAGPDHGRQEDGHWIFRVEIRQGANLILEREGCPTGAASVQIYDSAISLKMLSWSKALAEYDRFGATSGRKQRDQRGAACAGIGYAGYSLNPRLIAAVAVRRALGGPLPGFYGRPRPLRCGATTGSWGRRRSAPIILITGQGPRTTLAQNLLGRAWGRLPVEQIDVIEAIRSKCPYGHRTPFGFRGPLRSDRPPESRSGKKK